VLSVAPYRASESRFRSRHSDYPDFSILKKHFLVIPVFPPHPVACRSVGNDEGAALTGGVIGERFFEACRVEGSKTCHFQFHALNYLIFINHSKRQYRKSLEMFGINLEIQIVQERL
jgi:hypothetical protein